MPFLLVQPWGHGARFLTDATVTGIYDTVEEAYAALDRLEQRQRTWLPERRCELFVVDEQRRPVRRPGLEN
jgi:hypothetical protein